MKIAIPRERRDGELRVAATPRTVEKLVGLGAEVIVESGAGTACHISDEEYRAAGAEIAPDEAAALGEADVVFKVQRPVTEADGGPDELKLMKKGALLIGLLAPTTNIEQVKAYAAAGIDAMAMELLPRITRAQSMDALSSQSNLAGYRAVLDAAYEFHRALPMMMTAAGTVAPARVMILGAGVAGLQAIATARRLGAIVVATDVRLAAKEQVESLGASFVMVEDEEAAEAETEAGYAREMSKAYQEKQAALIAETLKKQDIAICTALIPGKPAPMLISEEIVQQMKPGAVIVDLAAEAGGNCACTEPGKVVDTHGVRILGHLNVPSRVPVDAAALYANNLYNFIAPLIDKESKSLAIDWEDEIVKGTLLTREGAVVHPQLTQGSD